MDARQRITNASAGLVSVSEAVKLLPGPAPGRRTHVATVHRWIFSGKIRGTKVGGRWFVELEDLERMLTTGPPASHPPRSVVSGERARRRHGRWTEGVLKEWGVVK